MIEKRFEIKANPYHPSSGDTYHILDNQTGQPVPMHNYSDTKWDYEQLGKLVAFLNELAAG